METTEIILKFVYYANIIILADRLLGVGTQITGLTLTAACGCQVQNDFMLVTPISCSCS